MCDALGFGKHEKMFGVLFPNLRKSASCW